MTSNLKTEDPIVFISYCWADSEYVDKMETVFSSYGKNILRDVRDAKDYTSIKEFMKKIKTSDYVILIVSDSYMKSKNCMYEILELLKNDNYNNQIFPVIIKDAELDIYSDLAVSKYLKYWKKKYDELYNECKAFSPEEKVEQFENLRIIKNIRSSIGAFISTLQDLKSPSLKELQSTKYLAIRNKIWHHTQVFNSNLFNRCLVFLSDDNVEIAIKRYPIDNSVVLGDWLLNCIYNNVSYILPFSQEIYSTLQAEPGKLFELYVEVIKEMKEKTIITSLISDRILNHYIDIVNRIIDTENKKTHYGYDILKEKDLENIINTNIKLINILNSINHFNFKLFNPTIFLISIKYFAIEEDMRLALKMYPESDYVQFGDWILGRPKSHYARGAYSIISSALIIREIGQITENCINIRNNLIDSFMNDSFSYDWEYNDWVQLRKRALINALAIICDENCINALKSRFNKEINIEAKIAKANILCKSETIRIEELLHF